MCGAAPCGAAPCSAAAVSGGFPAMGGLLFVEGDEIDIDDALNVAANPVVPGGTPAASKANFYGFLDAGAAAGGNNAANRTRGLHSIAYNHLTPRQMLAILNQWRHPVWIANRRAAAAAAGGAVGNVGQVFYFNGTGRNSDLVLVPNVFD